MLWRFRYVVALGAAAATVLATLSYYNVSFEGGTPKLTPSKSEVWQARATMFLTQPGFPAGAVQASSEAGRFIGLAPLYARFANSDDVKRLIVDAGGPLDGEWNAVPTADTTYGSVSGLPMVTIFGTAATAAKAIRTTERATDAFLRYVTSKQTNAKIEEKQRVELQVINAAGDPKLIVPRKKTLPIVVFLAIMFATAALVVVLENLRPRRVETEAESAPEPQSRAIQDVRRLA